MTCKFHQDSIGKMDGGSNKKTENGWNMTSQLTTDASWTYNVTQIIAVPPTQTPTAEDASQLLLMAKKLFLDQSNLHHPAHLKVR